MPRGLLTGAVRSKLGRRHGAQIHSWKRGGRSRSIDLRAER